MPRSNLRFDHAPLLEQDSYLTMVHPVRLLRYTQVFVLFLLGSTLGMLFLSSEVWNKYSTSVSGMWRRERYLRRDHNRARPEYFRSENKHRNRWLRVFPDHYQSFTVPLVLVLHYLDDDAATLLEISTVEADNISWLARDFCKAVQEQAGGVNVGQAAKEVGVVVETMPVMVMDSSDNFSISDTFPREDWLQCHIVGTNRVYDTGGEFLGDGYFSLELLVEQVVYIKPLDDFNASSIPDDLDDDALLNFDLLSPGSVRWLIENGFNRGRGGRVRFRQLLRAYAPFELDALLDVEVLSNLSPPQKPPTRLPSTVPSESMAPTDLPSLIPTLAESSSPSLFGSNQPSASSTPSAASRHPTTISIASSLPTPAPSAAKDPEPQRPTYMPLGFPTITRDRVPVTDTLIPSVSRDPASNGAPSMVPSSEDDKDLMVAASSSSSSSSNGVNDPLVIAAVIGGASAVLIGCCFCLFCFYFKKNKSTSTTTQDNHNETDINNNGRIGIMSSTPQSTPASPRNQQGSNSEKKRSLGDSPNGNSKDSSKDNEGTVVPTIVQLDDDHRSLANTTLGEHTAGRKPPKKKRLVELQDEGEGIESMVLQSFDEESLYTTPGVTRRSVANTSMSSSMPIQPGRHIDEGEEDSQTILGVAIDYEDEVFFPTSDTGTVGDSSVGNDGDHIELDHHGESMGALPPSPLLERVERILDQELGPESESESSALVLSEAESPISLVLNGLARVRNSDAANDEKVNIVIPEEEASLFSFDEDDVKANAGASNTGENAEMTAIVVAASTASEAESANSLRPPSPADSRSSLTSKVGNLLPATPDLMIDTSEHGTPDGELHLVDSLHDRSPRRSPDAPGHYMRSESKANVRRMGSEQRMLATPRMRAGERKSRSLSPSHLMAQQQQQQSDGTLSAGASPKIASPESRPERHKSPPIPISPRKPRQLISPTSTYRTRYLDLSVVPQPNHFVPMTPVWNAGSSPSGESTKQDEVCSPPSGSSKDQTSPSTDSSKSQAQREASTPPEGADEKEERPVLGAKGSFAKACRDQADQNHGHQEEYASSSGSTSDSDVDDDNDFLFDAVEEALGPRSPSCDVESLGGRSNRSTATRSVKSQRSRHSTKSGGSGGSTIMHGKDKENVVAAPAAAADGIKSSSSSPDAEKGSSGATTNASSDHHEPLEPRSLEHDLRRLELQLKALRDNPGAATTTTPRKLYPKSLIPPPSPSRSSASVAGSSPGTASGIKSLSSFSTSTQTRVSKKQRVIVVAPPGKLGIILANRKDGNGTVISEVRPSSALHGAVVAGDKLVAVNGQDVTGMVVKEITAIMAAHANEERQLTVVTTSELRSRATQTSIRSGIGASEAKSPLSMG